MSDPCANPIAASVLSDYWIRELPEPEAQAVEGHLLGCDSCCARLRDEIALAKGIGKLAGEGNLLLIVSEAFLEQAASRGMRVRQYAPPRGGSVECTVTREDDLLVGRLAADLSGTHHLDVALCDTAGNEWLRLHDVPFHPSQKEVIFSQPIGMAKASGPDVLVVKLISAGEAGERELGRYRFNHTPS